MKPAFRCVIGNLAWNRIGQVWAIYRVTPVGGMHDTAARQLKVFSKLRAAMMRLPAESMLLSLGEAIDADELVAAMVPPGGIRGQFAHDLLDRTAEFLTSRRRVGRSHFIALCLDDEAGRDGLRSQLSAAMGGVGESFGLATMPPAPVVARYRERATALRSLLGTLELTPVTAGEVRWLTARLLARGMSDVTFDATWEPRGDTSTSGLTGPFGQVRYIEGGDKGDPGRGRHRRYVRGETEDGIAYHTCLVLADMPANWTFPGHGSVLSDFEAAAEPSIDGDVIEADVAVRIKRLSNTDALRATKRKRSKLAWQHGEYGGSVTGTPGSLGAAADQLVDMEQSLETNRAEPELQCTVIIHLADDDLPRLERHASSLQATFEPANYGLSRPLGDQPHLLSMMLPGSPAIPPVKDFAQHLLARDLASCLPLCGGRLGDSGGGLLGIHLDSGLSLPVMFDPARGPSENKPGNLAACGGLGAGKSLFGKRLIEIVASRGGQVITIDRTERTEYVTFANGLAAAGLPVQVIQLGADTGVCMDPLVLLSGPVRVDVAIGFYSQLLGIESGSMESTTLAEVIEQVAKAGGRSADILAELDLRGATDAPEAKIMARRMHRFARMESLRSCVFGAGVPLDMDAAFVVFSAAGLDLVSRDVLFNEHLAKKMLDNQIAAQALLYLVAALARRSTFGDHSRFSAALLDEFWALEASPHGAALVREWLRDSRKHNAAVWMFSQHPNDFGEEIRSFLGIRAVFRQQRLAAARAALDFLEMSDEALAERLVSDSINDGGFAPGMCLFADLEGHAGVVQVLRSLHPDLRAAADTNPVTSRHHDERPLNGVVPDLVAVK